MYYTGTIRTIGGKNLTWLPTPELARSAGFIKNVHFEDGIYMMDETWTIVVLGGELLPIYDSAEFRVDEVFGCHVLIRRGFLLRVIFERDTVAFSHDLEDEDGEVCFRYARPGAPTIHLVYKGLSSAMISPPFVPPRGEYGGVLSFPISFVRTLRPKTLTKRFGDDVRITAFIAGDWRRVPYWIEHGVLRFHYPILTTGFRFDRQGDLSFHMLV